MGPCLAVVGSTTAAAVFEAYVGRALAPALRPGQVVVLDNLGAHKGERVRELIEERGVASCCSCRATRPEPQPHRGGVLEGEGVVAAGRITNPKGLGRGDGQGVGCGDRRGHPRVHQALRLPVFGPTSMTTALGVRVCLGTGHS